MRSGGRTELFVGSGVEINMGSRSARLLLMLVVFAGPLWMGGTGGGGRCAWAQPPAGGGESREERRERWRRFGDGGRGRSNGGDGNDSRRGERRDGSNSTSSDASRASSNTTSTSASSSSKPSSSSTSSAFKSATTGSSSSSGNSMAMTDYAKQLVKQFDKNGDNMLQPDERKELRSPASESDLNKDGVITIDELVAHLSSNSAAQAAAPAPATTISAATSSSTNNPNSSSTNSSSSNRSGGDASKLSGEASKRVFFGSAGGMAATAKDGDKRHSYRFTSATDRLPSGLPSWFTSKDANLDGQVQMSEYSRYWTKSIVDEFRRYDRNDDGFITAKEAAKK